MYWAWCWSAAAASMLLAEGDRLLCVGVLGALFCGELQEGAEVLIELERHDVGTDGCCCCCWC